MFCWQRWIIIGISVLALSIAAYGQEISREQIKGLDEQIQEIKGDVLGIAAELNQLEEKLLYPSNTQVAVFVSLVSGETFRLDSVEIRVDGEAVSVIWLLGTSSGEYQFCNTPGPLPLWFTAKMPKLLLTTSNSWALLHWS